MTNKEIAERAQAMLMKYSDSKSNQIDPWDLLEKVNEALRLIKALAENDNAPRIQ